MRVWTNGTLTRAWTSSGHFRVQPKGRGREVVLETPIGTKKKYAAARDTDVAAWDPALKERIDDKLGLPEGEAVDVRLLAAGRAVAVLGGSAPRLAFATVGASAPTLVIPLGKIEAPRVAHPEGCIWETPVYRKDGFGPRTRVRPSPSGVAVCCDRSGLVGVVRPGSSELDFALRAATAKGSRTRAVATRWGALIAVVDGGEAAGSVLLHVDETGTVLGRWPAERTASAMVGPRLLDGEHCVSTDRAKEELVMLRLPGLVQIARKKLAAEPIDIGVAPDGSAFAMVTGPDVIEARVQGEKVRLRTHSLVQAVKSAKKAKQTAREKAAKAWKAEPAEGPAQIGFDALKRPAPPWCWDAGHDWKVTTHVRSAGEAGEGLSVVVTGAALDKGLVELGTLRVGEHQIDFALGAGSGPERIAELGDVPVPPGVVYPWKTKPRKEHEKAAAEAALERSHLELVLTGRALKPGKGMLRLAISTGGTKPMKWIRPVEVRTAEEAARAAAKAAEEAAARAAEEAAARAAEEAAARVAAEEEA